MCQRPQLQLHESSQIRAKLTGSPELVICASGTSTEPVRAFGAVPFDPADTGQVQTSSGALRKRPAVIITAMRGNVPL
jgi:hypothetical protein